MNHFATLWKRLDVRGKSSKELKEIIVELQKANRYLLRCVKTLDWKENEAKKAGTVKKNKQKQEDNKLITKAKRSERIIAKQKARKSVQEAKSVLQSKISDLFSDIRNLRNRIARGLMRERGLRTEIKDLKKQLEAKPNKELASQYFIDLANQWKDKYDEQRIRANRNLMKKQRQKTIKKEVIVEVEKPRSSEEVQALKMLKYLNKPIDQRVVNAADIAMKTITYLKDLDLTFADIQILFKGSLLENFTAKQIELLPSQLGKMEKKGYLSRDKTGIVNNSDYWFLTTKGYEVVHGFKNHISYGKISL